MKDTGVPALGAVPEHWQVRRLASLGRLFKGNGGSKEDDCAEGVPCVRYGDLYTTHTFHITRSRGFIPHEKVSEYTPIRYGDVLFAASGETIDEIGKSAVNLIESAACCGGDVVVFRPQFEVNARFLGYATDCRPAAVQKARMGRGITVKHIYDSELRNLVVALPPLDEQAAIVRFLDHADCRIRQYIRAKKKLIALLNEQKQAIIRQAVTRGLYPNAPIRPTGVAWLPPVPEHWTLVRLKALVSQVTSGSRSWSNFMADSGALFIRIGNLTRGSLELNLKNVVRLNLPPNVLAESARTRVQPNDILLSITAFIGSVAVVPPEIEEAYVSQHVACCRPLAGGANPRWVGYFLLSPPGQVHGRLSMYGGTKQGLSLDDVKNAPILLPPRDEQDRLVQWIENCASDIDAGIGNVMREIELLREYHTRLVADVVTGKLDVRDAARRLPDDHEEVEVLGPEDDEVAEEVDDVSEAKVEEAEA